MISGVSGSGYQYQSMQSMQGMRPEGPPPGGGKGGPAQFDTDKNQSLDKTEFTSFATDYAKKSGKEIDSDKLFSQLDSNGDGSIDKSEGKSMKDLMPPLQKPKMSSMRMPEEGSGIETSEASNLNKQYMAMYQKSSNLNNGNIQALLNISA